jgi:hypothetical protein
VDAKNVLERVKAIAETFAADRPARQQRRFSWKQNVESLMRD